MQPSLSLSSSAPTASAHSKMLFLILDNRVGQHKSNEVFVFYVLLSLLVMIKSSVLFNSQSFSQHGGSRPYMVP